MRWFDEVRYGEWEEATKAKFNRGYMYRIPTKQSIRFSVILPFVIKKGTWRFCKKSSAERTSPAGSAQCLAFSRRRSYIPAAVPASLPG